MKLGVQANEFHTNNVDYHGTFKVANTAFMQELLSDLYSDRHEAVIRELSTNAFEAHMIVGQDKPFDVWLPTNGDLKFKIRDYGPGLSLEKLKDMYTVYGVSDKRHSNEFTGGFGVGSKSPFAYTDMFQVISYHKGHKYIVVNSRDASGRFCFDVLSTTTTTEPDGLEVSFNVNRNDVSIFRDRATKVYNWFNVKPNIRSGGPLKYSKYDYISKNDTFGIINSTPYDSHSYVIMGQVAYPIDKAQFSGTAGTILGSIITHVFLKVDDVDIAPSREALKYTDKTKRVINAVMDDIKKFANDDFAKKVKDCKNLWEARLLAKKYFADSSIGRIVDRVITFNGQSVKHEAYITPPHSVTKVYKPYYMANIKNQERGVQIEPSDNCYFIENDSTGFLARTKELIKQNQGKIAYLINTQDQKEIEEFCRFIGIDRSQVIKTSTLPKPTRNTISGKSMKSEGCTLNVYDIKACTNKLVDLNAESGYYLIGHEYGNYRGINIKDDIKERVISLKGCHNLKIATIKAHKNWKHLDEYVNDKIKALVADKALLDSMKLDFGSEFLELQRQEKYLEQKSKAWACLQAYKAWKAFAKNRQNLHSMLDTATKNQYNIPTEAKQICLGDHYPMMKFVSHLHYKEKIVIDYLNSIQGTI